MFLKQKILALIPARGGSKGIKYKNLKKINRISLLGHVINFAYKCNFFDEVIVSTESEKISNEVKKYNAKIFKRSKITSKDYTSDYEVLMEVLKDKAVKNMIM